ncbi:unnamed protein product [Clonostachys byssicola]|uniref:Probable alpha/beta-glucosidase agdC n=1 Tax=Clonostachys byssicola TaxID=160290 RepID=A0A9N9U4W3_9HYPO|nr:unnamed protein product [Clonostachys byssicola]
MRFLKPSAALLQAALFVSFGTAQDQQYPDYSLLAKCPGYTASNVQTTDYGLTADLSLAGEACNAYGDDLKDLILEVTYEADQRLHVKIQDKANQVYQIPESVFPRPDSKSSPDSNTLKFDYEESPFSFRVSRRDGEEVLFDTSAASLIFESQYVRLRTKLPEDPYLYGLGEHTDDFRLSTTNYSRTLWNQDSYGVPEDSNLYGSQPLYLEHRESGSHGVFLLNSNGMDVMIDNNQEDGQFLEYNTLGGVLDFWFFAGPSPSEVTKQYAEVAGLPTFAPYWGLGFHQCRYGYQDAFAVAEVIYNYSQANIPLETMWTDIDYMDGRTIFTTDPERYPVGKLRSIVSYLHERNQHYIVMVDPAAGYKDYPTVTRGLEDNIFLLRSNGSVFLGVVWPGVTVFPDWFAENITTYWNNEFDLFFNPEDGIDIDGLWIDMNEPANIGCYFPCEDPYGSTEGFPPEPPAVRENPRPLPGFPCEFQPPDQGGCSSNSTKQVENVRSLLPMEVSTTQIVPRQEQAGDQSGLPGRDLLYPKYSIRNKAAYQPWSNAADGGLSNRTVDTNILSQNGLAMYDTHNLYGTLMGSASYDAMRARRPSKRPLIITRSTFAGSGSKVGHWLGDNLSTWGHYRASIRTMLAFTSLFQFPMTGSDTCGFGDNTTEELCARWASLGAFNTFYRNHNQLDMVDQEFYLWDTVAESARKAIDVRYRLLDYMYTAMARASKDGEPVLYPVFYLYPQDRKTWALENQFFYGKGVLVAPVLEEGATSVDAYLPNDAFYDWHTHDLVCGRGANHTFADVDTTSIPILIRSGVILPLRVSSANTTTSLREQDFELVLPLDKNGEATGELYFDDGESIDPANNGGVSWINLSFKDGELRIEGEFNYQVPVSISKITLLEGSQACAGNATVDSAASKRTADVKLSLNEPGSFRV